MNQSSMSEIGDMLTSRLSISSVKSGLLLAFVDVSAALPAAAAVVKSSNDEQDVEVAGLQLS